METKETKTPKKEKVESKPVNLIKEFFKFKLTIAGYNKGKKIIKRESEDPIKICKMLQVQADELNAHSENTLIEYKLK